MAFISYRFFEMPLVFCFCLAYSLATMGGAASFPGLYNIMDKGLGKARGVN